jgi:hypothetical protein
MSRPALFPALSEFSITRPLREDFTTGATMPPQNAARFLFFRFELRSPSKYRRRPRAEAKPFYDVSSHRIFQATKMMNTESGNHDE